MFLRFDQYSFQSSLSVIVLPSIVLPSFESQNTDLNFNRLHDFTAGHGDWHWHVPFLLQIIFMHVVHTARPDMKQS